MKRHYKLLLLSLCVCLLCGCNKGTQDSNLEESSAAPTESSVSADESSDTDSKAATNSMTPDCMPVLSIRTTKQDANVMDFVTQPVAPYVSADIASWTPNYVMPPEPYYEACTISLKNTDNTVLLDGVEAEVKVRGNWTTTYDKKPLRIKFTEKQNLLGLNDGAEQKNWLLLAEYKDASMLRDKAALSVARALYQEDGYYAADSQFVEVEINGEYWGVYLLSEQQQVSSKRVDINEPEPDYQGTDIGYFLEFDGYFYSEDPLHQFHVDYADNAPLKPFNGNEPTDKTITCLPENADDPKKDIGITIKSDIYSQAQHDFIASYVNNVYRILYEAAYSHKAFSFNDDYTEIKENSSISPQEAVEQVVDVQSLADMYIISELTCDADIYWSSFYMDVDFSAEGNKKLTFEAPWDFDSSMGNKRRCVDGTGFYAASIVPDVNDDTYETVNPWLAVLINEDWYQARIRDTWTKAYDKGIFNIGIQVAENDKTAYQAAFTRNYEKWNNIINNFSFVNELSGKAKKCTTQAEAADYVSSWLTARIAFLNDYWHS